MRNIYIGLISIAAAGCSALGLGGSADAAKTGALAELHDAKGGFVGVAFFTEDPGGVRVALRLRGLEPGDYAVHIHEFAAAPGDFESAGGHFNPQGLEHGLLNPKGPHAGDLPNIVVREDGSFEGTLSAPLVSLGSGKNSLFKSGGTSLVIHKGADDGKSQPSGKEGERVACGPIRKADKPPHDPARARS